MSKLKSLILSGHMPVIRTDFDHPDEWASIKTAITAPQTAHSFRAMVELIDEKSYEGLTVDGLLQIVPSDTHHAIVFLVDAETLTRKDRRILVVSLSSKESFRVVPSAMWAVQSNLEIANMDWEDFAGNVDEHGVFRGF